MSYNHRNYLLQSAWENYNDTLPGGLVFKDSVSQPVDLATAKRACALMPCEAIDLVERGDVDEVKAAYIATISDSAALSFIHELTKPEILRALAADKSRIVIASEAIHRLGILGEELVAVTEKETATEDPKPTPAPASVPAPAPTVAVKAAPKAATPKPPAK